MNVSILAIGTELLMGTTLNTNSATLSALLNELGLNVLYHATVGDNPARIKDTLSDLLNKSDIVVTTGGLGPTQDDLTREMIAEVSGCSLEENHEIVEGIKAFFDRINRPMNENNKKQGCFPVGSTILKNNNGTAPGFITEFDNKMIIALPGPPHEMEPMFEESVSPYLMHKSNCVLVSKYLTLYGIGESSAESKIDDIVEKQTNPTIATYAKPGQVTIRVTAKASNEEQATVILKPTVDQIKERLGTYLISENHESLLEVVAKALIDRGLTISLAESCTGGLLASKLTNVSGISAVFHRGYVTYSNEAKVDLLGVSETTLNTYGAVSHETAREMAEGLKRVSKSDVCISITGIAGPNGGTEEKPVGLVYIGIAYKGDVEVVENKFRGNRSRVRHYTCLKALDMIRKKMF